jgi:hypothetical protein
MNEGYYHLHPTRCYYVRVAGIGFLVTGICEKPLAARLLALVFSSISRSGDRLPRSAVGHVRKLVWDHHVNCPTAANDVY